MNVTVSGAETTMVRRVVRSERKPGERWKRAEPAVGYEARRGLRRGLVMGRREEDTADGEGVAGRGDG